MQSRAITGTAIKLRSMFSGISSRTGTETPLWGRTPKSISRTADPSVQAESPDEVEREEGRKSSLAEEMNSNKQLKPTTPIASSPSLRSAEVIRPRDPLSQQRRHYSSSSPSSPPPPLDQVSCVGIDGPPSAPNQNGRSAEEENTVRYEGFDGEKMDFAVVMESAEETFERASRIWKETAVRSWIRDAPQTKVLVDALSAGVGGKEEVITDLLHCPITA